MSETEEAPPRAYATLILVAANTMVFAAMALAGTPLFWPDNLQILSQFGAVVPSLVFEGDAWRLITALFVHAALWHVGMNMWVLVQVGTFLETAMGHARFLLLYFVSGLAGFALSVLLNGGITCGASGSVFGVVGGLLAYGLLLDDDAFRKQFLSGIFTFIVASLALGFAVPFIDNSAHIGGLLAGFALGYPLMSDTKQSRLSRLKVLGLIDKMPTEAVGPKRPFLWVGVVFALFALLFIASLRPVLSPRYHTTRAMTALVKGDTQSAAHFVERAKALAPNDASVLLLQARLLRQSDSKKSAQFYEAGLKRYSDQPFESFVSALRDLGGESAFSLPDAEMQIDLCHQSLISAEAQKDAPLLNNCAWFLVDCDNHKLRDPIQAVAWATQAVALAKKKELSKFELAQFQHTLAIAFLQQKDPGRAHALLKEIIDNKWAAGQPFEDDLERARSAAKIPMQSAPSPNK